ncbi:MAG TPA: M56 family metallopeptidase, partial [Rhodothermales bacterium]|nr:M56 family metallopeptidase [Rhodothermales bacterium]
GLLAPASTPASAPAQTVEAGTAPTFEGAWIQLTVPAGWLDQWLPWAVALWAGGVLVFSLRLAGGLAAAHRLRRRTFPPEPWLAARVADLAARMGLRRPVRVAVSPRVPGPVVLGWLRPLVLLPAAALTGLTPSQLEAVLAHELAHVRRHDHLVNLLQAVAEALLFYHPAVWWVGHRLRAEREHCCDDAAVAACGDVLLYARALADLEGLRPTPRLALAATDGSLLGRIRRLVGAPAPPRRSPTPVLGVVLACAAALVFVGACTTARSVPATPEMEATSAQAAGEVRPSVAPAPATPSLVLDTPALAPTIQPAVPVATAGGAVPVLDTRPLAPSRASASGGSTPVAPTEWQPSVRAEGGSAPRPAVAPLRSSDLLRPSVAPTAPSAVGGSQAPAAPAPPILRPSRRDVPGAMGGSGLQPLMRPSRTGRINLEKATVEVDGRKAIGEVGWVSSDGAVTFYDPQVGLFVVSDRPFEGAVQAGTFENDRLRFSAGRHEVEVRSRGTRPIVEGGSAPAYVLHDPDYRSAGERGWIGAGAPSRVPLVPSRH